VLTAKRAKEDNMKIITLEKPNIDCFAFCGEQGKECKALYVESCPMRINANCPFHKTQAQFTADQIKAAIRIKSLSEKLKYHISSKYSVVS
jgi:hypothetical protein